MWPERLPFTQRVNASKTVCLRGASVFESMRLLVAQVDRASAFWSFTSLTMLQTSTRACLIIFVIAGNAIPAATVLRTNAKGLEPKGRA